MPRRPIDPADLVRAPVVRFQQDGRGFRLRMNSNRWLVGRGAACDVVLPAVDTIVSRRHLLLQRRGQRILATNLGRHRARMNDEPLGDGARELREGDRLQVGPWWIDVEDDPGVGALTTAPPIGSLGEPRSDRHGLVGASPGLERLRGDIDRFARLPIPVLILGETGSGKERVARALHEASALNAGPFVAVNCGALLGDTARSEIFGHVRGAFTGADRAKSGAFVDADGGSLFLDEIGELSGDLQAAMLRTLDLGEVVPVGASKPLRPRVRVIAATHRDLHNSEGFRRDLLYRLDVASVTVPPLRLRGQDIALLARYFLENNALGFTPALTGRAAQRLMQHAWPGNVRELRNCMLRAAVASGGRPIGPEHLSLRQRPRPALFDELPRRDERTELVAALVATDGNRTRAAQNLGIARSTLYERLRRHGITAQAPGTPRD